MNNSKGESGCSRALFAASLSRTLTGLSSKIIFSFSTGLASLTSSYGLTLSASTKATSSDSTGTSDFPESS
jgi:hypothetical protein